MSNFPSMRACSPTTVSKVIEAGFAISGVGVGTNLGLEAVFLSVNIYFLLSVSKHQRERKSARRNGRPELSQPSERVNPGGPSALIRGPNALGRESCLPPRHRGSLQRM